MRVVMNAPLYELQTGCLWRSAGTTHNAFMEALTNPTNSVTTLAHLLRKQEYDLMSVVERRSSLEDSCAE